MQKVTIPAERILLERNQIPIDSYTGQAKQIQQALKQFLNEYKKLELGEISIGEIQTMLNTKAVKGAENLVRKKVAGNEAVKIQGIQIDPSKLLDLVAIPDCGCLQKEYVNLYDTLIRCQQSQIKTSLSAVKIVDGEAVLNEEDIAAFIEQYSTYAETDQEKEAYLLLKNAAEILDYVYENFKFGAVYHRVLEQPEKGFISKRGCIIHGYGLKSAIGKYPT